MTLTELIKLEREKLNISQQKMADITGIPKDRIAKWEQGKGSPKHKDLQIIADFLKLDLNKITGNIIPHSTDLLSGVPVYDIEFTAGFQTIIRDQRAEVVNYINIPEVKGCDVVVRARGDSMADKICDKDWIGLKAVTDMSVLSYGHIYAIVTKDMELVKYVRKSKNEDTLLLKSHNPNYDDFELHKSKVLELYLVKTVIPIKTII